MPACVAYQLVPSHTGKEDVVSDRDDNVLATTWSLLLDNEVKRLNGLKNGLGHIKDGLWPLVRRF